MLDSQLVYIPLLLLVLILFASIKILREYDKWVYRERHLIECFINKIKHFRRIFSRFEKLDRSFMGFLHFVGTLIWLR